MGYYCVMLIEKLAGSRGTLYLLLLNVQVVGARWFSLSGRLGLFSLVVPLRETCEIKKYFSGSQ